MKSEEISHVISLMERHGIAIFEYQSGATQLRLTRDARGPEARQTDAGATGIPVPTINSPATITSPCVGWFLTAHPGMTTAPPVFPRRAGKDEIVGYVRTGAMLRPVRAGIGCTLLRALKADGMAVGYGDDLFIIAS